MINPGDARAHLHELIDMLPDEQVMMVWMTFQGMLSAEEEDEEEFDDEEDSPEEDEDL